MGRYLLDSELLLSAALDAFAKGKYSLGWNSRWRTRRNYSMLGKDIQESNTGSSKFGMIGKSGLSQ